MVGRSIARCWKAPTACRSPVRAPVTVEQGDFVLVPAAFDFSTSSLKPRRKVSGRGRRRSARACSGSAIPMIRLAFGCWWATARSSPTTPSCSCHCCPRLVHVRGQDRLTTLVELLNGETLRRSAWAGRGPGPTAGNPADRDPSLYRVRGWRPPGLLRGLADDQLAIALRRMHERPSHAWTVVELAQEAALSRSTFFEQFGREVESRRWSICWGGEWLWRRTPPPPPPPPASRR